MSHLDILINMIIVSIPEEIFLFVLIILWTGNHKFLCRKNVFKIFLIAVLPTVIISSIKIYMVNVNTYIRLITNMFFICIVTILLLKPKKILKTIVITMYAFGFLLILETLSGIIYTNVISIEINYMNQEAINNFFITLPIRLIEYSFLYMFYKKRNNIKNLRIIKVLNENDQIKSYMISFIFIYIGIFTYIGKKIIIDNILYILPGYERIIIIIIILTILLMIILIPYIFLINMYYDIGKQEKF